jgi:hypothetical protein
VAFALPILGGFAFGLAVRGAWQRHFALVFRLNTAAGLAVLAFLAGWSFQGGAAGLAILGVILAAQVTAVVAGAWLFRRHDDAPLLSFALYGNPGFWAVPMTAALFGPRAAVVIATYDMLTQPRIAAGVRFLRARAPIAQAARTGLVDYAPTALAVAGLAFGRLQPAPGLVPETVVVLGTVLAVVGAMLLGLGWPQAGWLRTPDRGLVARLLAVHLTLVPGLLIGAALAGVDVPAGAWVLALGPLPLSMLSFARLYGYSSRLAAFALATSIAIATGLLPVAVWLSHRLPA